ncbi:MAG: hypothetical protein WA231_12290, partial [Methylocella sp.]
MTGGNTRAAAIPNAAVATVASAAVPLQKGPIFLGRTQLVLVWQWLAGIRRVLVRLPLAYGLWLGRRLWVERLGRAWG